MWVYKIVDKKIIFFLCALVISVDSYANQSAPPTIVAQRKSRIQKGYRALPKAQQTFQKVEKKKTLLKYVKPPFQSKLYFKEGTDEAELERIGLMEIRQLYNLLKTSSRPDLQLRLASLYAEQAQLIESRIYDEYDLEMELYKNKERTTIPKLNLKPVREYSQKAVNLFQFYLRKYPKSRKIDTILFHLAYSYFQLDQPAKGRSYYERLVKNHPKSEHAEAAYFQLGEYYFDQRKWKQAERNYQRASRFNSRFQSFAQYKLSWCKYNQGQVGQAMKLMEKLISEGRKNQGRYSSRIDFSRNALNDLSSFYIYSKYSAADAVSYFGELVDDEKQMVSILEKIGFGYKDIGNIRGMRTVFNLLIRLHPFHPKAYDYKYQIVQAYSYAGQTQLFKREFTDWLENYGVDSEWADENSSNKQLLKKVHNLQEVTVRNYTFRMHHGFTKTRRQGSKVQALFGYQVYFKYFDWSPFYPEVRFHYGELLFELKDFKEAVKQYDIVATKFKKSKVYETALLNRVLALEKILPSESQVKNLARGKKEQLDLPEVVMDFQTAVDAYSEAFPKKKNTSSMVYALGTLLLEYKHYEKALGYLSQVVLRYASQNPQVVIPAVHSILDTYNLLGNFQELEKQAQRFIQIPAIKNSKAAKDIYKILREVELKSAQDLAQTGKTKQSAQAYEKFYKSNASSPLAITALYNAALNYRKAGELSKSLKLYNRLSTLPHLSKYPKISNQVLTVLPELYQTQGLYLKSAYAFKNFAQKYPKHKNVSDYWYNAALIFDGLNFYKEAVSAYLKYQGKSSSVDKNQVYFLIARIREKQGQTSRAIGNYIAYLNKPDRNKLTQVIASHRLSKLASKDKQKWQKTTIRLYNKHKVGLSMASKAQFAFAHNTYKSFKKIRIPKAVAGQERAVQRKLNLLEKLKNEVKDVIRMNDTPRVVAALMLMALANNHLGRDILNSAVPKSLGKADVKKYKEGLAQAAQPFLDSSKTYLDQALRKSEDSKMYNPWVKEANKLSGVSKFKETIYPVEVVEL